MRNFLIIILSYSIIVQVCFAVLEVPAIIVKKPLNRNTILLTSDEISEKGINSLAEALQSIGGIQLLDTSSNSNQGLISIRGFGANANSNSLILVDGMPWTNPDLAAPDLNAIPIRDIASIEFYPASEGVLWGDQAVGGVINIVTKKIVKDNVTASCGVGNYQQRDCYLELTKKLQQLGFSMGIENINNDNYRKHNDYEQTMLTGKLSYPYEKGNINFSYKIAKETMQYPGALTHTQLNEDRRAATNDTDFFSDWSQYFLYKHRYDINENWNLDLDFLNRDMHGNGVLYSAFTQSRMINILKPQLTGSVSQWLIKTGIEIEADKYSLSTDYGDTRDQLQQYDIFGLATYALNKKLNIVFGSRLAEQINHLNLTEKYNTHNTAYATQIELNYQALEFLNLYLRRAGSFRFPKADELASIMPGDSKLATQKGISYETGLNFIWLRLQTQLSAYQLNLTDEIAFDPTQTPQDPFGTNRNLPPTQRRGFSISETYQVTSILSASIKYNFVNARFKHGMNKGNQIPLVAENLLNANINYKILKDWNVYAEAIYTGSQYPDNDDGNINSKIGGYTIFNFNTRYQIKNFSLDFRLNNMFNKFYNFYTIYLPFSDSIAYYPASGRNFLLSLKYTIS